MEKLETLLVSFTGRIGRGTLWAFLLVMLVVSFIWMSVVRHHFHLSLHEYADIVKGSGFHSAQGRQIFLALIPLWLAIFWPSFVLNIKRLHDRDRNGWWIIPFVYLPWLGDLILRVSGGVSIHWLNVVLHFTLLALNLWGSVELLFLRGTVGDNRFGPDPLAKVAPPA